MKSNVRWLAAAMALVLAGQAAAIPASPAATLAGRRAARETLRRFEALLDSQNSATEALRQWCALRHLADPAAVAAARVRDIDKPADAEVRRRLGATPGEPVRYRRVRLTCGGLVLSEADNWYRPGVLTPEMNQALDGSDRPFGAVVRSLDFKRRTLAVQWLFDPLSRRARSAPDGSLAVPHAVLRHRAILVTGAGRPFSLVEETYTEAVLAEGAVSP